MAKSCVCFLTKNPHEATIAFALQLRNSCLDIDVYIVVDCPSEDQNKDNLFVTINDEICSSHGYHSSNIHILSKTHRRVTAWDKVLYFLNVTQQEYEFAWIFEDDVFIPSVSAFQLLLAQKYQNEFDLVTASHGSNTIGEIETWHWKYALKYFPLPWFCSMSCAIGISRNLLIKVHAFTQKYNRLGFIEIMFNTLAHHHQLKVKIASEFSTTIYFGKVWTWKDIRQSSNYFFHPAKELELHPIIRNLLMEQRKRDESSTVISLR